MCGLNGKGKTNLLDAIYQLCFTKSYFGKADSMVATFGKSGFSITGTFTKNDQSQVITLILRESKKKELFVDKELISPFSLHIGKLPLVFIAPDDTDLITGSSEIRRKMIDTILSQIDNDYLKNLINYHKVLDERNSYLRRLSFGESMDETLLDSFDHQLVHFGGYIIETRIGFFSDFIPIALSNYAVISNELESPTLNYVLSADKKSYLEKLKKNRQRDIFLQRTTIGIHKDDMEILLNEMGFKLTASQGQRKSMLFALKLAEFTILKSHFGYEPILLLDDVFEKLDHERLLQLLNWVCVKNKGQVILTDTHPERVQVLLDEINVPYQSIILN
jgi:DNA replication and repair protein RecF